MCRSYDGFRRVLPFLNLVRKRIANYYAKYSPDYEINYEEVLYALQQIYDDEMGEYENPLLMEVQNDLRAQSASMLKANDHPLESEWTYDQLLRESLNYGHDVVWHELEQKPRKSLNYMCALSTSFTDESIRIMAVYTLNHDLLLEEHLRESSVPFNDGEVEFDSHLRLWSIENYYESKGIPILHLHGHVRLYRVNYYTKNRRRTVYGRPVGWDSIHTHHITDQEYFMLPDGRPEILAGTTNKLLEYQGGIYADMQMHFYNSLRSCEFIVACGYGFRDKGINTKILEWLYNDSARRLVIIHPKPSDLRRESRSAISQRWDELVARQQLQTIDSCIDECYV